MPDEGSLWTTFELRPHIEEGNKQDIQYLADILHRKKDVCYDRYYYRIGNSSGSFIVSDGQVVKITDDDVRIRTIGVQREGVYDFVATMPNGTRYLFAEREHVEFRANSASAEITSPLLPADYTAVCGWQISEMISPSRTDTIRFAYRRVSESQSDSENLVSYTYSCYNGIVQTGSNYGLDASPCPKRIYTDKCLLAGVNCCSTRIELTATQFDGFYGRTYHITAMHIGTPFGKTVRSITFSYNGHSLARIASDVDGTPVDSRSFTYYTEADIENMLARTPSIATEQTASVIDLYGRLRSARRLCIGDIPSLHLRTVTSAMGATATYDYEPSICPTTFLDDTLVCTGLRVCRIRVSDPVTNRTRTTTYHYEQPATTIDFSVVSASCFVMPGGSILVSFPRLYRTYTSGATLTSLCRIPGKPMENAEIYYARVTEDVGGTATDTPLRTVYEYDLSDIVHPFVPNGGISCNRIGEFADDEGRVMFTHTFCGSSNTAEETIYTLDGRVAQRSILTTGPDGSTHTEDYQYSYDTQARLLKVTHSLDGGAERALAENVYDALGRISENRREGSGMLTARYSYDVCSRIKAIVCPLFRQYLYYGEPSEGGMPQYGGNISAMDWQVLGDSLRGYRYAYDGMGRLISADYREGDMPSDHYSAEYVYDLQGNILALWRNGRLYDSVYGAIDDLTYEYNGNQLTKVTNHAEEQPAYKDAMYYTDWTDQGTERTYDANGNMVSDADRQIIRISYSPQNQPWRIDYFDGSHVDYNYDTDGVKLRTDHYINPYVMVPGDEFGITVDSTQLIHTWREYVGNCIYENDTLSKVLIDGGYVTFEGKNQQPLYHYYIKDYLGNNRMVIDEEGQIEEVNHYYPFGGLMGDSKHTIAQPYKYIGKELDSTLGLDWYDHSARHYDPVIGRWNVMDAMAEKYYSLSPYVSCGNNPVNIIDLNGLDWYLDIDKTFQYNPHVHSQKDLNKGQVYKAAHFTTGKGNSLISYRRDGSILYANETKAYNRIWNQASVHYRRMGEKGGREVAAFILTDNRVLVLPDYNNTSMQSEIEDYGYQVGYGVVCKGNEKFKISAQIHTHQERTSDTRASHRDRLFSKKMGVKPVLIMGHDGFTRGYIYNNREIELVKELNLNLLRGKVRICIKGL